MTHSHPLAPKGQTKIHIIGAGGVGMSGLALLLQRMGVQITASDRSDSTYLQKLKEKGIETWVGSQPEKISADARVYYSTAIKADDRERQAATAKGMPCEPRHELLKIVTQDYFTIAVAGCHGKTTTSAWIADLLIRANLDPTALIGGTVPDWNSNYRAGQGARGNKPILVIEADESDRSFLSIVSQVALITNVDLDHTDIHASLEALEKDFLQFAAAADANGGWIHVSKECPAKFSDLLGPAEKNIWDKISLLPEAHALDFAGTQFAVGLAGIHNLKNASLVLQLGLKLEIAPTTIAESLLKFTGVNRRMQKLAEFPHLNLSVIDDYAHHPHEVEATLAALAPQYERLLIFWEPHRLSRFSHFHGEFARALESYAPKHSLISLPIYASGDTAAEYPDAEKLFEHFKKSPYTHVAAKNAFSFTALALDGRKTAAVFMGAGASSEYAKTFAEFIAQQKG